ncbi:MAG TPA: glycosyltransferase, partial [Chitinophagaceae bacterium]|nr:glycosyltransferase [Chitinophagaceae bacterium]
MEDKIITTAAPTASERKSLRLMIFIGVFAVGFFLYSMLQRSNISYFPLYVLLMITLFYYVFKFLHEWYHYFSISYHPPPAATRSYTVDIFTTFCAGEPFDMLEETLTAMQKIRYPHTSWCCDEADDPQVKALCARLGVQHVTRTIKKDAKAGNINNALQYATGEICLVLDPDHVPVPGIIDEIIGYFEDPGIGFVQIVQAYYNQTETMVAKGAAQQTYQFYGPVMMTMNTYGTAQAIGANCTFRRAALDSIGGHASGLAEDMHTAMQMHAKGWRSVYHPAILTRGLVPATMSSYYKQQLKWSRGTWELFLMVFPKLFSKFTWRQRLHYFTLPFHYLSGLIFLINFLIPVVSLCTGYIPLQMDILSFMLAAFPLFCMGMFIRHYVQKWVAEETERGFHVVGGILQIGTWWIHSVGLVYTLFRKKVPYIPTPKNDHDSLPLRLSMPNILVALISFAAIVYGFWHDYTPYTVFMAVLAFMQIVFMVFIFSISGYVRENSKLNHIATKIKEKNGLIIRTHGFVRKYSVPLSIAVIIFFVFGYIEKQRLPAYLPKPLPQLQVFYRGNSIGGEEPATEAATRLLPAMLRNDISIVSMMVAHNADGSSLPDTAAIKKISASGALPLLQWSISANPARQGDTATLQAIAAGQFDSSIYKLARHLADLQQPIFFQPMIPVPLSDSDVAVTQRTRTQYLQAWQQLHSLFAAAGANQVIWVWSIPPTDSIAQYFPGSAMADWAAVQFT